MFIEFDHLTSPDVITPEELQILTGTKLERAPLEDVKD